MDDARKQQKIIVRELGPTDRIFGCFDDIA
jgi:hypothetical protein